MSTRAYIEKKKKKRIKHKVTNKNKNTKKTAHDTTLYCSDMINKKKRNEKSMTEYIYKHNEYTFHNFKTTIFLEN
jgi:hypothetical protein